MTTIPWLLAHFCIGVAGTWLARRYALHRNLVDQPGERRSHALPTPRGGGIAIVVAMLSAGAFLWPQVAQAWAMQAGFLAGLLLVAGVGLIDDHGPLSPWLRLGVHAVAAVLLAVGAWLSTGNEVLAAGAFLLAMVLTNVWNFMDGIDGLAASQALLAAAAVACIAVAGSVLQWLALALVAATAGFLPFNFPKARIFLGDVGSGALGYSVAMLVVAAAGQGSLPWWLWSMPLSAFLIDAGLTLMGRLRRGEAWWRPHTLHAYQGWARRLNSHARVTLAYGIWTLGSLVVLWGLRLANPTVMLLSCLAWYMTGTGAWWWLQRKRTMAALESME